MIDQRLADIFYDAVPDAYDSRSEALADARDWIQDMCGAEWYDGTWCGDETVHTCGAIKGHKSHHMCVICQTQKCRCE